MQCHEICRAFDFLSRSQGPECEASTKTLPCTNEPPRDKINKVSVRIVKTDKLGHPPSLIRVFAVRLMGSYGPKLSSCGQRRL